MNRRNFLATLRDGMTALALTLTVGRATRSETDAERFRRLLATGRVEGQTFRGLTGTFYLPDGVVVDRCRFYDHQALLVTGAGSTISNCYIDGGGGLYDYPAVGTYCDDASLYGGSSQSYSISNDIRYT